jgi:hypothetical protein
MLRAYLQVLDFLKKKNSRFCTAFEKTFYNVLFAWFVVRLSEVQNEGLQARGQQVDLEHLTHLCHHYHLLA